MAFIIYELMLCMIRHISWRVVL